MPHRQTKEALSNLIFNAQDLDLEDLPLIDCHLHTSWTDGGATVTEVYNAAVGNNLNAILFSEHSRKTSTDWFKQFADEVRGLPDSPCKPFVGTEVKVETPCGQIDTCSEISQNCDLIMASVHRFIDDNGNKKKYYRKFTAKNLTMEEKYNLAINKLEEVKKY